MSLAALRARLKELAGEVETLLKKEALVDEDYTAIAAKQKEMEEVEAKIKSLEAAERTVAAAKARPAQEAPGTESRATIGHNGGPKLDVVERIGLVAAAMYECKVLNGGIGQRGVCDILTQRGYQDLADKIAKREITLNSANASQGGILIPDVTPDEIIDLLRPVTTFLAGGPRRVPMPGGVYKQPAAATGATAAYRGETKRKPVSAPTFRAISMSAKLLAGIVPVSDQLLRWAPAYLRGWVEDDLRQALGQTMDLAMYRGEGTEYTPRGIFEIDGIYRIDAFGDNNPTIQEIEATAAALELRMYNSNLPLIRPEWRMSYDLLVYLQNLRDGLGNRYYPELGEGVGDTMRWRNKPVRATTNMPNNLGASTDEMELALVDFGHVLYGETLGMQMATSNEASVVLPSGQTINAFQDNITLFRAEMEHDVDLRYAEAVGVAEGIRWGRPDL